MAQQQHFLPCSHLKRFLAPDLVRKGVQKVRVYRRAKGAWGASAPRRLATEHDLYSATDNKGNRNDDVERFCRDVEDWMGKVFREKVKRGQTLSPDAKARVAVFVALQAVRVPHIQREIGARLEEHAEDLMRQWQEDPQAFARAKAQYEMETGEVSPDNFGPPDPSQFALEASKGWKVGLPLLGLPRMAREFFLMMSWTFLTTKPDRPFITSDNPVCMMPEADEHEYVGLYVPP